MTGSNAVAAIDSNATRTANIYCPDCGWIETIEATGPAHPEHMPTTSAAEYHADDAVRRHCGDVAAFRDEIHRPFLFTEDGVRRFEPEVSSFAR